MPNDSDELPIHEFARDGNVDGVCGELAKGVSVDAREPGTDRTPLMVAVSSFQAGMDLVRLLIQKGADVNAFASEETLIYAKENIEGLQTLVPEITAASLEGTSLETIRVLQEKLKALKPGIKSIVKNECVLSLAVRTGNFDKVEVLLNAGADVRYERPHGYDVLIDAMYGGTIAPDAQLVPLIQLLIDRGARLNTVTQHSESALSVASRNGRFDAVSALLTAGADPAPLKWTPLMHAIALDSLNDVRTLLDSGADLSARDSWSRTPWLLSLQAGDVSKAKLLQAAGAGRLDRGRCGKPPLAYPIVNGHADMLLWLLSEGFDPKDANDFNSTPLMEAAESGQTECVKILIDAGADIHRVKHAEKVIPLAKNIEIVRLLVNSGADLNDINDEMRASLTRLPNDGKLRVSRDDYLAAKHRCFGKTNPEKMNFAFWKAMVMSGAYAYAPRKHFNDTEKKDEPVWCFIRFGKSINELPDGRIVEIGGEHEDYYDPDFCIYNDVIVHHGDGKFDIYGYPDTVFPPTDSHTATLVGAYIFIIGGLGYPKDRRNGETPVFRLNTDSFEIENVETSGEKPGWINKHKATNSGDEKIRIFGGKVSTFESGAEEYQDNIREYVLDLGSMVWSGV